MLTETGTTILKSLNFNGEFDFPKPTELIKRCLALSTDEGDYCLDFFSGSATTTHAVMQLNAENGGKRKFILVQLPELTNEKSEAYKASYINICEIGKERIRRAGMRIENELCKKKELLEGHASMKYAIGDDCDKDSSLWTNVLSNEEIDSAISKSEQLNQILVSLDTGFRVLKLDSTATNFEQIFKTYSPNTTIKIL